MLAAGLTFLRNHSMPDIVFRELTGNNLPHVLIVRNQDELVDQSISQFGNTAAFFGTGFLADHGLEWLAKRLRWVSGPAQRQWFSLGKSLSIFSLIASVNLAMPFLRNWVTTARTGTLRYADMVGAKTRENNDPEALKREQRRYIARFLKTLGVGLGLSVSLLAATVALMRSGRAFPRALSQFPARLRLLTQKLGMGEGLATTLGLKDGRFKNFSPYAAVAFWVIPTYQGLIAGARDKYEVKELMLRFAAFNLAFFIFPNTLERLVERLASRLPTTRILGPRENVAYLGKFLTSLVCCSAVPTVLNIHLTRSRVQRDEADNGRSPARSGLAVRASQWGFQRFQTATAG